MRAIIKSILLFVLLISFSKVIFAATVYGNIYDLSLSKVSGVRVEVNTTPQQHLISTDGSYSFDIPNGFYNIKAELHENGVSASESRNISVAQEGNYVIDLILFPSFEEEDEISQDIGITLPETEEKNLTILYILVIIILITIFYFIFKNKKIKKSNEDVGEDKEKDLNKILGIIKKESGRTTQKQIRKEIPLSEAKISLMIAELEHKGIIEKIKKGRGNIIILKKK